MKNYKFIMKKISFIKTIKLLLFAPFYLITSNLQAQLVNSSKIKVAPNTLLSVHFDFTNAPTAEFINDGKVLFFNHWTNNGKVDFTNSAQGTTYFTGQEEQIMEGETPSTTVLNNFKNVVFNNNYTVSPFILATDISISGSADFQNGIVDADTYNGKVIFENNGIHTNASNNSFVDGKVEKKGKEDFEYPVGDANYYRPSFHSESNDIGDVYTSQYFFKNSNSLYPHSNKQDNIVLIDNQEYWVKERVAGSKNIVLTLSLNPETIPSEIYDDIPDTNIQIVRWDAINSKWIVELSATDLDNQTATALVSGYGIFTLARVNKEPESTDNVIVYNFLSTNGDGLNDFFHIKGIDKYPDNSLEIYNRWGVLVYETKGYNENDRVFTGFSDGRATVRRGEGLPTGTYFYVLKYNAGGIIKKKAAYLYISD